MFCSMIRRRISRSLDEGRALSARVLGHVRRCPDCGYFYKACLALHEGLARADDGTFAAPPSGLDQRILAAWPEVWKRNSTAPPKSEARLRPLFALALPVLVLATSIVLFDWTSTPPAKPVYSLARLERIVGEKAPGEHLEELSRLAESPLAHEVDHLKKDADEVRDFVASCLHSDIPRPFRKPLQLFFRR
jgi:hypothetical protein